MPERVDTTHVLMDRRLVLYQRERSEVWQRRYQVDGKWHRASTKEHDLGKAKARAERLMIEAEIRKHANLHVVTRKYVWREKRTGKAATRSTVMAYNGALGRVVKEAVDRGFLSPAKVPPQLRRARNRSDDRPSCLKRRVRCAKGSMPGSNWPGVTKARNCANFSRTA